MRGLIRLVSAFSVLLLGFNAGLEAEESPSARPNFILIIVDDVSHDDLGCYGNERAKTPHLDRLAANGLRFENAYLTCSSCSPSRCSLITGRYPHNTGACELHVPLPPGHFLFPEALKQAGYYTVLSGKHHMGQHANPAFETISPGRGPGREEDWVEILRDRPQDRPFFFWFAAGDAHRGWSLNEDAPTFDSDDVIVPPYLIDGPQTRADLANYYHEVSRTDTYVGRLVDELNRQQIRNNTYIIYIADNGRPFPRCKTRLYDSGIRSPLIVSCPTRVATGVPMGLVSVNIDIPSTILELAQVPASERMQGISFAQTLRDPSKSTRSMVFAEQNWHVMQAHQRMIRRGNFVYIRNAFPKLQAMCVEASPKFPAGKELWELKAAGKLSPDQQDIFLVPRPAEELFELDTDPHQLRNLVHDSKYAEQLADLRTQLTNWETETKDSVSTTPTLDRQTATGERHPGWKHRIQPGIENGSLETNALGPY